MIRLQSNSQAIRAHFHPAVPVQHPRSYPADELSVSTLGMGSKQRGVSCTASSRIGSRDSHHFWSSDCRSPSMMTLHVDAEAERYLSP